MVRRHGGSAALILLTLSAPFACAAPPTVEASPSPRASLSASPETSVPVVAPVRTAELVAASAEFNDANGLAGWLNLRDTESNVDRIRRMNVDHTVAGSLYLEPEVSSWFENFRGVLLYRELSGDVIIHLRLRVQGARGEVPSRAYSLAGAMVRVAQAPAGPQGANWLFTTTGTGERARQVEVKTTRDGVSDLRLFPADAGWVEVAMARVGTTVVGLYRPDGGQWRVMRRWSRPDLPAKLQWGIAAYTDWDSFGPLQHDAERANRTVIEGRPDMRLSVDFARFYRPTNPSGVDLRTAADEVVLAALSPPDVRTSN